jgi:hypothetical protein
MSYNGTGVFVINTAGQPVVPGTVISSTAFNALTADIAGGLSTALTKDGQTTPTANIKLGGFRIVNIGAGIVSTDAAQVGQIQAGTTSYITVSGIDTITGNLIPTLTAYAAGNTFSFVASGTNTGAVTINIDGLGAKAVTRDGSIALFANDITAGKVVTVVYDGTRFQLINGNSYQTVRITGNGNIPSLTVTGTGYSPNITLTDAASVAWDTSLGQVATFTFVSTNRTIATPTNIVNGGFYALKVVQNAGLNTLTWSSAFKWAGGIAPTLSTGAGAIDIFTFESDGTNMLETGRSQGIA